ncbi:TetR family transcriptional regulator [Haloferax sp. MBLA0076]|uniref:TetR family transcriptional regulator n=1 Tax=Haloferax litoreum TaxID=2666140 RepID=A0A6A8GJS0_9EURY|nr:MULTISPECIES: TetR/AcrR family transcriptional regulator [Haloferax]KAB1190376.1 TetR/AcrR family transcriptional regulator [Haloferax sp. CBA1148]MRX23345.1 TetR family transcriptional regulator [Haloferax litoreum]
MPQFTDERRREVRAALLDAGYTHFVADGLDGTTITDLTDAAGIAAGTFYSFFDSKEALYVAVLRNESQKVYDDLREVLDVHRSDPETAIRRFLEISTDALVENPIFTRTITRDEREHLQSRLSEEELATTRADKRELLVPSLEAWQEQGHVVAGDPNVLASALLYISYLPLHRDDVGDEYYAAVRRTLFDWAVEMVTCE